MKECSSSYRKTDQGMVQIKELLTHHGVLIEMQSSTTLSTFNSAIVNGILNNSEGADDQIHVTQKLAINEKPANDTCKKL